VIDAFVTPLNVTADYIDRLSKSEIPEQITDDYKGDFKKIKQNLNMLGGDIRNVLQATQRLSQAVQDGNLDVRGDTTAFAGGWRELVIGVNNLIDTLVAPFNVTAEYLDRIAKGDIRTRLLKCIKVTSTRVKNNVNLLIEAMHNVTQLAKELAEGNLEIEVHERSEQDTLMQALNAMIQRMKV